MKKAFFIFLLSLSIVYGENQTIEETNSKPVAPKVVSYKDLLSNIFSPSSVEEQSQQEAKIQQTGNVFDYFSENTQPFNETDPWYTPTTKN